LWALLVETWRETKFLGCCVEKDGKRQIWDEWVTFDLWGQGEFKSKTRTKGDGFFKHHLATKTEGLFRQL